MFFGMIEIGLTRSRSENLAFKGGIFPAITVVCGKEGFQPREHFLDSIAGTSARQLEMNCVEREDKRDGGSVPPDPCRRPRLFQRAYAVKVILLLSGPSPREFTPTTQT